MLGDSRLGDAGIASQCVDSLFTLPDQLLENGPTRRIGKSLEHMIGVDQVNTSLGEFPCQKKGSGRTCDNNENGCGFHRTSSLWQLSTKKDRMNTPRVTCWLRRIATSEHSCHFTQVKTHASASRV